MNYGLLAVASLRSKEALFPLNDPLTPTTLEVACNRADTLHALYHQASIRQNLEFHERVISALNLVIY